jgi:glycerol-3-phosphate dehydrogenase
VAGGKLTTHREIAGRVVMRVMGLLERRLQSSPTLTMPLPGARGNQQADSTSELPPQVRQGLIERYGTRSQIVARIATECTELAQPLAPGSPAIAAEVIHAVRNEFARSLMDFIARRTAMTWQAPSAALASAPQVAQLMAQELGWSLEQQRCELESFFEYVDQCRLDVPKDCGKTLDRLEQPD